MQAHPHGLESYSETNAKIKVKDAWTETKHHEKQSHTVHHDKKGYWKCACGARE